ncbi:MAG: hypothetical protein P8M12_08550 [Flavobacteriales bacterium]|nr:hypothetical protein [Flavobacteriales bacterium]
MSDLWNDSNFWRILINVIGGISILVAVFLIFIGIKKVIHFISSNNVRVLKDIYAKVYELPSSVLSNQVQFGFELAIKTHLTFSVNDDEDKVLVELYNGELEKGVHVFKFDSKKLDNGNYFLQFKSEIQNINRKITIRN